MESVPDARRQFGWQQSALLVADEGVVADNAAGLIEAAGARLIDRVPLAQAAERLAMLARLDVLVVAVHGAPPVLCAALVDAVARFAEASDTSVVLIIDSDQIDLVSARMLGGRYALLCKADSAELLAAIAGALGRDGAVHLNDAGRDTEAARLKRLNEEVARIAEALARLTRSDDRPAEPAAVAAPRRGYGARPDDDAAITVAELRQIIRTRRLRDRFFGDGLFEDPAWDMLLDLYAAHLEKRQVSVSSLCIAAAVAPTTALRWIGRMTDAGLFERQPDPLDRRRAHMVLSPKALEGMAGYFAAVKRSGDTRIG